MKKYVFVFSSIISLQSFAGSLNPIDLASVPVQPVISSVGFAKDFVALINGLFTLSENIKQTFTPPPINTPAKVLEEETPQNEPILPDLNIANIW